MPSSADSFQFIGLWLVLSFALQGVFGALLMQLATPRPTLQLLGATLLILSPPLIFRILHAALTAHWLLLAALWLCLRHDADVPSRRLRIGLGGPVRGGGGDAAVHHADGRPADGGGLRTAGHRRAEASRSCRRIRGDGDARQRPSRCGNRAA